MLHCLPKIDASINIFTQTYFEVTFLLRCRVVLMNYNKSPKLSPINIGLCLFLCTQEHSFSKRVISALMILNRIPHDFSKRNILQIGLDQGILGKDRAPGRGARSGCVQLLHRGAAALVAAYVVYSS